MENFDIDLELRLISDSERAKKSDSMILYASNLGVVRKKPSLKDLSKGLENIKVR